MSDPGMRALSKRVEWLIIVMIIVGGVLPFVWYSVNLGRIPASDANPEILLLSPVEQLAAVFAGYIFKPTYMFLALLLGIALWKTRKFDLAALKYAMFAFFIGEAWCAANYLLFNDTSYLSEYLHSYGMVVAFSFAIFSIAEGMDIHVIKLSARGQRCSALELCERCIKNETVDCGFRKVLLLLLPAMCALAFIPLLATISSVSYNTLILGTPYNYSHQVIYQLFENRYCPILALILFATALLILLRQPKRPLSIFVRIFTAAGLGALGFSFFRLLFTKVYANNLMWSTFWEELTELLFLIATWSILLCFRYSLLTDVARNWPWTLIGRALDFPAPQAAAQYSSGGLNHQRVVLIACKIIQEPLLSSLPEGFVAEKHFMEFGLHRHPDRLRQGIQEIIDNLIQPCLVVLGYGLCGNGLHGIKARQHTLLIPRVDDCIPILLGSYDIYLRQMQAEPATFYLSPGWLESGSHPLNEYQEYLQQFGRADSDMLIDMQYRNCKRLAFVSHNQSNLDAYREQAQEVARFCQRWGTRYQEILGSDSYIRRLVEVLQEPSKAGDDFLIISPGCMLHSQQFLRIE
jgi:hypothetical protein